MVLQLEQEAFELALRPGGELGSVGDLGNFGGNFFVQILEIIIKSLSIFFLNFEIFVKRFKIFEILNFFIFQILQKSKILREKIMLLSKS